MMYLLSNDEIRGIERHAMDVLGLPGIVLMERAALKVTEWITSHYDRTCRIVVVCGPGNNGGDGFAIARQLLHKGYDIRCILIGHSEKVKGDARINRDLLKQFIPIEGSESLRSLSCDLVIDALFGTGLKNDLKPDLFWIIDWINACPECISVDMPSGIGKNGQVMGTAVQATSTITFASPKHANIFYPGASYNGELVIADIGLPEKSYTSQPLKDYLLTEDLLESWMPKRSRDAHKGQLGHLVVVSGSPGMSGAAILNCRSAMRLGTGLVSLALDQSLNPVIKAAIPEIMTLLLEKSGPTYSNQSLNRLEDALDQADGLLLGSGAGRSVAFEDILHRALLKRKPTVLDADALNLLAGKLTLLEGLEGQVVLTPHIGEMARLTGVATKDILAAPLETARAFAQSHQVILVMKSARTIVALPDGTTYTNVLGNAGMATAGAGDVLAGMIAGLVAQGMALEGAALVGTYLHSLAGDLAQELQGESGLMAGDIIDQVKNALQMTFS